MSYPQILPLSPARKDSRLDNSFREKRIPLSQRETQKPPTPILVSGLS